MCADQFVTNGPNAMSIRLQNVMKQSLQVASQVELHWPQVEQKSLVALLLCRYVPLRASLHH